MRQEDNVTPQTLHLITEVILTRRNLEAGVNGIHDLLGIATWIIGKYETLLQKVTNKDWDAPLEGELLKESPKVITEIILLGEFKIPNCVLGQNHRQRWMLLGFRDGGKACFHCLILRPNPS